MEIRWCRLDDPAVSPLLAGLAEEYEQRYGANDELARASASEFEPPRGGFAVLLDGAVTAAGGGFRPLSPEVCEVKRMWTAAAYRRQGLASEVLGALESSAREAGYTALRLETGPRQPEAAAMYAARGYRRIPVYGHYREALAFEVSLLP